MPRRGSVRAVELVVQKYGGTSVAGPERIRHVARSYRSPLPLGRPPWLGLGIPANPAWPNGLGRAQHGLGPALQRSHSRALSVQVIPGSITPTKG